MPSTSESGKMHSPQGSGSNGKKPELIVKTGDFCPNEVCPDFGKVRRKIQRNIIKAGKSNRGIQRYRCKTCGKYYTETVGTITFPQHIP
jgi:hypothetical protein